MKTWEVYKIALENPEARFIRKSAIGSSKFKLNANDELQMVGYPKSAVPRVDEDWELVREPVDFMTAVKALGKVGVRIRVICGKYERTYDSIVLKDNEMHPITAVEILEGKWYIED